MPYRLLKYILAICDTHLAQQSMTHDKKKLPIIVPLVFYAGTRSPYPYSTDIYSCFENPELAKKVLFEPFSLLDITAMSDETLIEHGYAAVMELLVKHICQREIIPVIQRIKGLPLFAQIFDIGAGEYRRIVLKYITDKGETENKGQVIELLTDPSIDVGDDIMTIAEQWKQEGVQQGMQQGEHHAVEKVAKRLLAKGLDCDDIAEITELSKDEIKALEAANH